MAWQKAYGGLIQPATEWDSGATLWDVGISTAFDFTTWDYTERAESWDVQARASDVWAKESEQTSAWGKESKAASSWATQSEQTGSWTKQ